MRVFVQTACGGDTKATKGCLQIFSFLDRSPALLSAGGVTQIIMIDNAGRDKDSVSSLTSGENFSATWLRSN